MKLNELTKTELIDLLKIILECGSNYTYIRISDIVFNFLLNRFNKQFDSLINELDKIKIINYLDVLEYENLSKKIDKLESERERRLNLDELEECKRENNKI